MSDLLSPKQTLNVVGDTYPLSVTLAVQERLSSFEEGFSENTNRARTADFKIYKAWCDDRNLKVVPSSSEQIERFMWDSVADPKIDEETGEILFHKKTGKPLLVQIRSVVTIERYLSTIKYLHDISHEVFLEISDQGDFDSEKYRNPANTKRVRIALKAIKRRFRTRPQRQAAPLRLDAIDIIISELGNSLRHTLYKALISVAFDSMMRCSELVRIELEQISLHDDGSGSVFVPFHKSDQEGEGGYRYLSASSISMIHDWCSMAHIESGFLFRSVGRGDIVRDSMHKDRVAKIYKATAKLCGIDSSKISAHSTRVGAAQELLANGVAMPALMVAGDWKSPAMPVRYAKKINVATGAMADLSKSRGR